MTRICCIPAACLTAALMIVVAGQAPVAMAQEANAKTPDDQAWEQVDSTDTASLETYLKGFPTGTHAEEAKLAMALQAKLAAIRAGKQTVGFSIPFDVLGARWESWKRRNPEKGVIGYFAAKGDKMATMGWFRPLTGGKTPGRNVMSFDEVGMMVSPTGDGSIIAFMTEGLKYEVFRGVTVETPAAEPMFFAVLERRGLVHLKGTGKVTLPDGKVSELK